MAKPVEITNRQGKTQLVTPGRKYPFTKPDGTVGYIVYDDKGGGQFTADPSAPKPKPKPMPPVSITNRQGETQLVTPGRGYPFTKPDGTRGYIVYDDKGGAQFTAYPTQPKTPEPKTPAPAEPEKPAEPRPKPVPVKSTRQQELDKINADKTLSPEEKWEIANPGLAAARRERKAIRGTSETDNPLMTGLRDAMPSPSTALDPKAFKADLAKSKIKPSAYSSLLDNPRRMKFTDSYDLVLDYLLSEGHADTVDEAHYVMMQMDAEYIQSIVEDSAPIPNIPTPTPTEKPKDKKKPPADTKIPDRSGYGPEEGGVYDREVRVPPNSYGDLRFPPNQRFNRGLGGPPPNTNTRPNTDPTTNTKPKPRKPLISLYPGQKGDGLMGPYIQFGNTRLGIPNISPIRPDK